MRKNKASNILESCKLGADSETIEALNIGIKAIKDDTIERHIIMTDILNQFITALTDDCEYIYDKEGNVTDMKIPIKLWYNTIDNID